MERQNESEELGMRKLIAGMKMSLEGKIEAPETADWVYAWADDYGLTPQIGACVLGGDMYPGYEQYWTAVQSATATPSWVTGSALAKAETAWARFSAYTPHYVLSRTLTQVIWPNTIIVRGLEEIASLKQQSGKDIYLVGGARTTASFIDAGLVNELRLIVHPMFVSEAKALFAATERRSGLKPRNIQQLSDGRTSLIYGIE
jgi:dihydrofolate reductase